MPLTKQYLRYEAESVFNIIGSANCNAVFATWKGETGRHAAFGASEDIVLWDLKLSEKILVLPGDKAEVTRLVASPDLIHLAAGYADGTVKVFHLPSAECVTTLSGHRAAVTCLVYNGDGHLLASGSKDTEVILWDVVAERGVHRLSGHKDVVTQLLFMQDLPVLISSSKDSLVKFWHTELGHGFKTLVGHKGEVKDMVLMCGNTFLVTGCPGLAPTSDGGLESSEISVWRLTSSSNTEEQPEDMKPVEIDSEQADLFGIVQCRKVGYLKRAAHGRLQSLISDPSGRVMACLSDHLQMDLYHFYTEQEARQHHRKAKAKKKAKNKEVDESDEPTFGDHVPRPSKVLKFTHKVKSCDIRVGSSEEVRICVLSRSNTVELHGLSLPFEENVTYRSLTKMGHRSDVRAVCFSSDGLAVATGSAESVKLWNRASLSCLRTLDTGYVYSLCFVPGDRHLLVGKNKTLLVVDINTAEILEEIEAHENEIWSIILSPDENGCISGSGDKTVKLWDFELVAATKKSKARNLSLLHTRTLQLDEGVLCVSVSPNSRFLAVGLLDSTVKIFFLDTLKLFVQLYGHKLPVLCMAISYDSMVICTGSADRTIKIWGLDFGDCHRSLFAHDDTVTGLQFVPGTHYFFSGGKDGAVKQWDADSYERIQTLKGHNGAVHALAVSANHVASCGADRAVRVWVRTAEPLVLEDEREEEREQEERDTLVTGADTLVPGQPGAALPSRKTVGAEQGADLLREVLAAAKEQLELTESQDSTTNPHVLMVAYGVDNPYDLILQALAKIKPSELEEALLLLPFPWVSDLLEVMPDILQHGRRSEAALRTLLFVMRVHHDAIVAAGSLAQLMKRLSNIALTETDRLRDAVGDNLHDLLRSQRRLEMEQQAELFREATFLRHGKERKRRRREQALKRAILTL